MALSAELQEIYRTRLTEERARIEVERDGLESENITLGIAQENKAGGAGNHIADDATDVMEQERNLALIENLQNRRRDIDHALARLDEGTYGVCARCGKAINPERLEALPFVTLCIDCQTLEDETPRPAAL
ncbi:MAG TPA: TraR/DksA C4-type zinc finger protein [Thermomicrobiales bacterium]|jgi:DnaK suppressor protein